MFLRSVQAAYKEQRATGMLPAGTRMDIILNQAVDEALDFTEDGLKDIDVVLKHWRGNTVWMKVFNMVSTLMGSRIDEWSLIYMLRCFMSAHKDVQKKVGKFLGDTEDVDEMEAQVIQESQDAVALAQKTLDEVPTAKIHAVDVQQVANLVAHRQEHYVTKLVTDGLLEDDDAHQVLHALRLDH
jgi:hypothetical protein